MKESLKTSLIAVAEFILILVLIFGAMGIVTWLLSNDVNPKKLKIFAGVLLGLLGIISLLYGEKTLKVKGGIILKTFDSKNYPSALVGRVTGVVLITVGLILVSENF